MNTVNPLQSSNDKGLVQGLSAFGTVSRQDIDVLLLNEPDTFNLFLLALKDLQDNESTPWTDPMSYYQIAGIHGLPNRKWDGVDGKSTMKSRGSSGYCAHGRQTFPTWHRPYLAMIEQSLYKKMLDIVDRYHSPRKAAYVEAVKKFRLPYWDYHRPRDYNAYFPGVTRGDGTTFYPYDFRVPQILTLRKVKVRMHPDDRVVEIDNPLSRFKFPDGAMPGPDWTISGFDRQTSTTKETMRYVGYTNPVDALNSTINKEREGSIRQSLNFVEKGAYNTYIAYATAGARRSDIDVSEPSGSLEAIHGDYHMYLSGGGHMGAVTVAAFDPIFWFHHCQIDRWFAVWQAAHPNSWFAPPSWNDPTKPTDDLLPFRHPDQQTHKYWDSNLSVKTKAFGYTYPDLEGIENDPAEVQKRFKGLYDWARRLTANPQPSVKPPSKMEPLDLSGSLFFKGIQDFKPLNKPTAVANPVSAPKAPQAIFNLLAATTVPETIAIKAEALSEVAAANSTEPNTRIEEEKVSREWYIDDVVQRLALNTSFSIMYLIGNFETPEAPAQLLLAPTFAGLTHVFTAPIEACDNCGQQDEEGALVSSTTPITSLLLDYVQIGHLESMRPEHVKPFLVKNLKWRVVTIAGDRVDPRELSQHKDFKISISCKVAPLPGEQGTVVYENFPEISEDIIRNAD